MDKNRLKLILYVAAIAVIGAVFYTFVGKDSADLKKFGKILVNNQTILTEIVDTVEARAQGLSGRNSLPLNQGMLFVFPEFGNYGFWMVGMKFPIDIVWISGDEVVGVTENIDPQTGADVSELKIHYPPEAVNLVLELAANRAKFLGIKAGDQLKISGL